MKKLYYLCIMFGILLLPMFAHGKIGGGDSSSRSGMYLGDDVYPPGIYPTNFDEPPLCSCSTGTILGIMPMLGPGSVAEIPGFSTPCATAEINKYCSFRVEPGHEEAWCNLICNAAEGGVFPYAGFLRPYEEIAPEEPVYNVPSLTHFVLTESTFTDNEINLVWAPKGSSLFHLHVNLKFENGQDILSAWCTGNEALCKAVGNGKDCSGTNYTTTNTWCYKAE